MLRVICAFTEPLAAGLTEVGLIEHVGGSNPAACTEQLSETELAKSFIEPTVTVTVSLCPALSGLGLEVESEKSGAVKVAVTDWSPFMVTAQVVVPEQAPLQPAKVDPEEADWLNVTTVPGIYVALQVEPQLMPAGLLLTAPVPLPAGLTLSTGNRLKTATTWRSATIFKMHGWAPEQA